MAPSYTVLCARPSRKMVPSPTSTGMTDMWMWVMVGRSRVSSEPNRSVSWSSISGYMAGLPSSRDHDGCVPHLARYSGTEAMISSSRSKPR
jgi:hypothetical protein